MCINRNINVNRNNQNQIDDSSDPTRLRDRMQAAKRPTFRHSESPHAARTVKIDRVFDGSCPLCRAEIGYYRRKDQAGNLCFVDVAKTGAATPEGTSQQQTMARLHVRASDGRVLSGPTAFVEVWSQLPHCRWAARAASVPGVLATLELCYRMFLPVRPFISRFFKRGVRSQAIIDVSKQGEQRT